MLVLASTSPRRKELLSLTGWLYEVIPADVDERVRPGETPKDYVLRLAQAKAQVAFPQAPPNTIIIAADTAVVDGQEILGKPANEAEAEQMLRRLRGRSHQVYTALAVLRTGNQALLSEVCITHVYMRHYSDEEMHAYIASGDPLDKAGAYAIQHSDFNPVEELQGCYANVVGLPLCLLAKLLKAFGVYPQRDLPLGCQEHLGQACSILREELDRDSVGEV